jgi:hypothetical protein
MSSNTKKTTPTSQDSVTPTKAYVVVRATFEYDDNYYHFPDENGCGIPTQILATRADAEKLAAEMNIMARSEFEYSDFQVDSWDEVPNFYSVFEVPLVASTITPSTTLTTKL